MPSKSPAQRRKMAKLYEEGKITKTEWEHFKHIKKGSCKKKK